MDLLRIIIAILIPPLGVFLQVGIGKQFWINILLTLLGYIPGIVHAVWVIAKYEPCFESVVVLQAVRRSRAIVSRQTAVSTR